MKAIIITEPGGPEALVLTDVDAPEPTSGEVSIKVAAAGVNRADVMQRMGHYNPPPGMTEIPGLEVSGVIDAVGEGVTEWVVGDEVCALLVGGGYAEQVTVPAGQVLALEAVNDHGALDAAGWLRVLAVAAGDSSPTSAPQRVRR